MSIAARIVYTSRPRYDTIVVVVYIYIYVSYVRLYVWGDGDPLTIVSGRCECQLL